MLNGQDDSDRVQRLLYRVAHWDGRLAAAGRIIHDTAIAKGWWNESRKLPELVALMHSELSEALEHHREDHPVVYRTAEGKPDGWAIELIDCVIRILDVLEKVGLDPERLLADKMAYNVMRPHRHGGKKI